MGYSIAIAHTPDELERCFSVMKELRPHLDFDGFYSIYAESHKADGYEIAFVQKDGEVLAVMGYRFLCDMVRGRHLYIDDLVATEKARSQGYGAALLGFAESVAKETGCPSLRLCAALENTGGIRFYERNGWTKRTFSFVKKTP